LLNAIGAIILPLLGLLMFAYLGVAAWHIYKPGAAPPVHTTTDDAEPSRSGRRPARRDVR